MKKVHLLKALSISLVFAMTISLINMTMVSASSYVRNNIYCAEIPDGVNITVDGDIDNFYTSNSSPASFYKNTSSGNYDTQNPAFGAKLYSAYKGPDTIYLLVEVTDPTYRPHINGEGADVGDGIYVSLNFGGSFNGGGGFYLFPDGTFYNTGVWELGTTQSSVKRVGDKYFYEMSLQDKANNDGAWNNLFDFGITAIGIKAFDYIDDANYALYTTNATYTTSEDFGIDNRDQLMPRKSIAVNNTTADIVLDASIDTAYDSVNAVPFKFKKGITIGHADDDMAMSGYMKSLWKNGKLYMLFDINDSNIIKRSEYPGRDWSQYEAIDIRIANSNVLERSNYGINGSQDDFSSMYIYSDGGLAIPNTAVTSVATYKTGGYIVELCYDSPLISADSALAVSVAITNTNGNAPSGDWRNKFAINTFSGWYGDEEWSFYVAWDQFRFMAPETVPLTFGSYKVSTDNYISNVTPNKTVLEFKAGLTMGTATVVLKDKSGNGDVLASGSLVTTGTIVEVTNGPTTDTYKIVIFGDVDGNGLIGLSDLTQIRDHLLESDLIEGDFALAADIYGEGNITLNSLVGVMAYVSESGAIDQNNFVKKN